MNLALFLFLIASLQVSAKTISRETLNVDFKEMALVDALKVVERKTDYRFVYNSHMLSGRVKVTVIAKDIYLEDLLKQMLAPAGLTFQEIGEKLVAIKKNGEQLAFSTITGRVIDEQGNALVDVSVFVKGTKTGTVTKADGSFSINAKQGDVLEFSAVGYKLLNVTLYNEMPLTISMVVDETQEKEVVVVGYGKQKSSRVVSSIATIRGEELQLPNRSLQNGLAGRVAGLIAVQRSGEPGYDNAEIYIRGISSFAGGTSALVLVDGVPRKITDISPEEIETFTILKDASATAVYGAEGANGVILITSKRGKSQKVSIEFRSDYNINQPTRVMQFIGSPDFLRMYNEAKWNSEGNPSSAFVPFKTDEEIAKYESGEDPDLYPNTNWMDLLKKNAASQRYSLNFRGGGERLRFFVASSYFNEEGLFKSNPIDANEFDREVKYSTNIGLKRYNLRSNVDMDVSKTTMLHVDISGQYLTTNYPGIGTGTIFTNMMRSAPYLIPMVYSNGYPAKAVNSSAFDNPYTQLNFQGYTKEYRVGMQTNVGIQQKLNFIPGLTAKANISFDADFFSSANRARTPSQYIATGRDTEGKLTFTKVVNGNNTPTEALGGGFSGGNKRIYMEGSLNYSKTIGGEHAISGLLLGMQKENQIEGDPYLYRKQSIVGRTSYAFRDKYFIDASFGFTGSENFAPGNRFGFFPAIGIGYTISNEEALKDIVSAARIDRLKFRVSIGRSGNDQVASGRFPYKENLTWSSSTLNLGMSSSGGINSSGNLLYEKQAYNANIHWEVEEKRNVGIDLSMFKGGINLTVDYFDNLRHDILIQRNSVSGVAGLMTNPYQNYGKVSNKGFDGSLDLTKNFGKLGVSFRSTFTYAHNKVIEMDEVSRLYAYQNQTGHSMGMMDAWVAERLYTEEDFTVTVNPTTGAKTYKLSDKLPQLGTGFGTVAPGNIKYADLNGDMIIDNNDWTRTPPGAKTTVPEMMYGFGLNLNYKGFSIGSFFQGSANSTIYMNPAVMIPFAASDPRTTSAKAFAADRWTEANPNSYAMIPRLQLGTNVNDNRRSTWWLRDGDFLRLKNLEVGYSVSKEFLQKFKLQTLRVYVLGQNLAVWDSLKYWDPEQGGTVSNIGLNAYPIQRSFNIGVQLTF